MGLPIVVLNVVPLSSAAAFAGAPAVSAEVVAQRRAAVEPVVRVEPLGDRRPGRRVVPFRPEPEGGARTSRVTARREREGDSADPSASPAPETVAEPSAAFLAQYIGQVVVPEDGRGERESAAALAYRAAAERDISYFGLEAPVDFSV